MRRKERFLTAVYRQEPDRLPLFDFLFNQTLYEQLIGLRPEEYNASDAINCALALNLDGVWIPFGSYSDYQPQYLSDNIYLDEWGTTYRKTSASWPIDAPIEYPIQSRDDLRLYNPPDPSLPGRNDEFLKARNSENGDIALTGGVSGPLGTAWMLMGPERIFYSLHDDPDLLIETFKISNEYYKEAARIMVEAGCDAIWVSEDLGDSQRGFFKLDMFRELIFPYIGDLVRYIADLGLPVLLHSCGQIAAYLDDLVQIPIDAIHPLQRTAGMDLKQIKDTYGDRICIIGNIDASRTLSFGTVLDVEEEVREAIDIAAPGGGYILASDHSIHNGIPIENILAMFHIGSEYGQVAYNHLKNGRS